jgi:hypothetical protein
VVRSASGREAEFRTGHGYCAAPFFEQRVYVQIDLCPFVVTASSSNPILERGHNGSHTGIAWIKALDILCVLPSHEMA